jgi:hypothetical protein
LQQIKGPTSFRSNAELSNKNWLRNLNLSFAFGVERRLWIAAAVYVLLLSLVEAFYLRSGLFPLVQWLVSGSDPLIIGITAVYCAGAFYLSTLFILATLSSKWPYKIVYFSIFTFAVLLEFGYTRAIGRFTNGFDVGVALSATGDQQLYSISNYLESSSFAAILGLFVLIFLTGRRSVMAAVPERKRWCLCF